MKRIFFFILLAWICVSCDIMFTPANEHLDLACENNSNKTVYLAMYINPPSYRHRPFAFPEEHCAVEPGTTNYRISILRSGDSLEQRYKANEFLCFYVFPSYTHEAVYLDEFKLVSYKLSLDDMIALDFKLSYPPDERMKDMEMDPPYTTFLQKD